jgi:long-subunit acyl-CoA synthetase (AMP-forming)
MQGLVLLPVHGCLGQSEIEHIIRKTNPALYFVSTEYLSKIEQAVAAVSGGSAVGVEITAGMLAKAGEEDSVTPQTTTKQNGAFKKLFSLYELKALGKQKAESGAEVTVERVNKENVSAVLYTSGSTGVPKGAVFYSSFLLFTILKFDLKRYSLKTI